MLELARTLLQREPAGKARQALLAAGRGLGGLRAIAKLVDVAAVLARGEDREAIGDADLLDAAHDMPASA